MITHSSVHCSHCLSSFFKDWLQLLTEPTPVGVEVEQEDIVGDWEGGGREGERGGEEGERRRGGGEEGKRMRGRARRRERDK